MLCRINGCNVIWVVLVDEAVMYNTTVYLYHDMHVRHQGIEVSYSKGTAIIYSNLWRSAKYSWGGVHMHTSLRYVITILMLWQ